MKPTNLVFIISQPRSGSSLLQQLLLNIPGVVSVPETWALPALAGPYAVHQTRLGYNPAFAAANFKQFLRAVPQGEQDYFAATRQLALGLFGKVLDQKQGVFFLEKTPGNYQVLQAIEQLFPEARYIFLRRNPVSVFASVIEFFNEGAAYGCLREELAHHLLYAPEVIAEKSKNLQPNQLAVSYEDVVLQPEQELKRLAQFFGVEAEVSVDYALDEDFEKHIARDTKSLHLHQRPNPEMINSWKKIITRRSQKAALLHYLHTLGPQAYGALGYDYHQALAEVRGHEVGFDLRLPAGAYHGAAHRPALEVARTQLYIKCNQWLRK